MDAARFHALALSLPVLGSRRVALTAAVRGALGLAFGAALVEEASAKKNACPPCKKRKTGKCKKK